MVGYADPPVAETSFLGVSISLLDLQGAVERLAARPAEAGFAYVVTPNAQHVVRLNHRDPRFLTGYAGAWLRLCDGQGIRLLARLLFGQPLPLATGSDLTVRLFAQVIRPEDAVTVIGGDDELARRLRSDFGLRRLAQHQPPMGFYSDPHEVERCVAFVEAHPARFVFLAVGAPQSEELARRIQLAGRATGVGLCIGSSLNFLTGMTRRAPGFMRRLGLEWLFRLLLNPRRHARRVFVESLPLVGLALKARLAGTGRSGAGKARP